MASLNALSQELSQFETNLKSGNLPPGSQDMSVIATFAGRIAKIDGDRGPLLEKLSSVTADLLKLLATPPQPIPEVKSGKDAKSSSSAAPTSVPSSTPARKITKVDNVEQACTEIIKKHDAKFSQEMYWLHFSYNPANKPSRDYSASGYESARTLWKVFLNPKKDYFAHVFERVFEMAKKYGLLLDGKINIQARSLKASIHDPCEPKFVIYFRESTSELTKIKLKEFIDLVEQEFSRAEIQEMGCDQGTREVWVEKSSEPLRYEKKEALQWGPSFTKMRNKLIYFSQGGFSESGRDALVRFDFDAEKMNELFEGVNFYRYKNETDPFGDVELRDSYLTQIPKSYARHWLKQKMLCMTQDEQREFFESSILPHFSEANGNDLLPLFELYASGMVAKDFAFLEKLKTDCSSEEATRMLEDPKVECWQWILRYSKGAELWLCIRKEETRAGFEIETYPLNDDPQVAIRELQNAGFQNLISPFTNRVLQTKKSYEPPFILEPMQQVFLLSELEALDKPATKALISTLYAVGSSSSRTKSLPQIGFQAVSGDRFSRLPADDHFLQKAKKRIIAWTEERKKTDRYYEAKPLKASAFEKIKEQRRLSSVSRQIELAKAKLEKNEVSDEEVSVCSGKTVAQLRSMKIQETYEMIQQFDEKKIANVLGVSEVQIKNWLVESEKELWLNDMLTELGGAYSEKRTKMPLGKLHAYLIDLRIFLRECEKHVALFTKPMQLLKMHNLLMNLDLLEPEPYVDLTPFKKLCQDLIEQMLEHMKRTRLHSLVQLTGADSVHGNLREIIAKKVYGLAMTVRDPATGVERHLVSVAKSIHPKEYINHVRVQAVTTLQVIEEILVDVTSYDAKKAKLSEHMVKFCDCNRYQLKSALTLLKAKLETLIKRQEKRLKLVELGIGFEPAAFFHGTPQLDTIFQIATTAIRPAHGKSFYGAFVSTFPAMLMYGEAMIGVPASHAFSSDLQGHVDIDANLPAFRHHVRRQGRGGIPFQPRTQPLFFPDKMAWGPFEHATKEKWIGLKDPITMNSKMNELTKRFYQAFESALFAFYQNFCQSGGVPLDLAEYHKFEAKLISLLEKNHLLFSFVPDKKDKATGSWACQIEDVAAQRRGQYKPFDAKELQECLKRVQSLEPFQAELSKKAAEFLSLVYKKLEPESSSSSSSSSSGFVNAIKNLAGFGAQFEVVASRAFPQAPYIIVIDEEELLSTFFANKQMWKTARRENRAHKFKDVQAEYLAAFGTTFGTNAKSHKNTPAEQEKAVLEKSKELHTLLVDTHVVSLMEQLIEFDFTTKEGVRVLSNWNK